MNDFVRSPSTPAGDSKLHLPASCDPPGDTNPAQQKTWVVFGATGHMGRSLVKCVLAHGDKVTAVGRTWEHTIKQMEGWHDNCLGALCDVRLRETVDAVLKKTISHWGGIDIIANCTGYGVIGACEDQDLSDMRAQFETNFFGTLNIIQLSLPYFRTRNAGRYLIFSSTSGALGVPGLGPYCATKYAVEGLIESMLYEIDAFGIKATLVAPGHLRIDEPGAKRAKGGKGKSEDENVAGDKMPLPSYGHFLVKTPSAPYAHQNAPAGHAKRMVQWMNDNQPTSAVKSAELVWQLGHCRFPPLRLLLGSYAVESIRDRLKSIIEEIEDWKHLSFPVADMDMGKSKDAESAEHSGMPKLQKENTLDTIADDDELDDHMMDGDLFGDNSPLDVDAEMKDEDD
ncbi:short chain dehydrogenase/reductase family protein [Elsinoe ampelina]|uniref:Short chain dehydrogenase/reductase family protein n=1 Tax=Elsinoe ampelina TaxID=302913 RepID=A0A6A6GK47_9PEZI|nr:short chain dehydrogenase/reductase family protein [Elsinoe ampelina]